ncbi:substrate-binding domain-containing protein [Fontivita pretiosa]|uniref:XylR family transcriptional regulator n=1 Tax=Fontivita pretiosa TaxID=2989684 RepID=UPI003D171F29
MAIVLPTEYAYARGVLRGIIAATRERNLYAAGSRGSAGPTRPSRQARSAPQPSPPPWLFRVYRGIYGHWSRYFIDWFTDFNPDAVICQIPDDRMTRLFRDTGKPVVELFESRPESPFPRILPDDVATGQMAAQHFLERGFRHFAFFGGKRFLWSREREKGFRQEIERAFRQRAELHTRANPQPNDRNGRRITSPATITEFTFASHGDSDDLAPAAPLQGRRHRRRASAMSNWLLSLPKPLALFAANDLWGFELVQAARDAGLHVPDDVAVLGVDNEELLCEMAHPPLSSIRIAAEQIGRAAVMLLDRMLLEGLTNLPASSLPPRIPPIEVVTRQSTDVLAVEDPNVAEAIRYIRAHAVEGLSVKQMLDALPVNRRTLERRFISVLGHSPLDEIRRVRLERAKALLQTDLPIYEVAARSGFATAEYLATSFLQATGMTPTAYRRQFAPRTTWQNLPPRLDD